MEREVLSSADIWAKFAEIDRIIQENAEKMEKFGIQVGGISNNMGHHAEQYFQSALAESLTFGGIKFDRMVYNLNHKSDSGEVEFDIALVNGNSIAIIEVKNRIHPNFIKKLAEERVEKFRKFFPEFKKLKAYIGIAAFSFSKKVLEEAEKYGIGIIRQHGKSIEIEARNLRVY
jgi:Holliday junction resolvase